MDRTKELATKSVGRLLFQYSAPAIVAMIVNSIYNVVDRMFIGNFAGEAALAGLTIAFPVMMIIFAFAGLPGIGGSSLLSIKLGERDTKSANKIFGNTIGLAIVIAITISAIILLTLNPVLKLFGATPETLGIASSYMKIILFGFIFQAIGFSLNNIVRAEGHPVFSMVSMITSALTNIVLDYFFIVVFGWGVEGAAYATIIGQLVGCSILLSFYFRKKSILSPVFSDFILKMKIAMNIITVGFATFITTIGTSLSMMFMNRGLVQYGGMAGITSMGAINSLYTLFIMPLMGISQGMQPIIGFNHGAKQTERVYKTLTLALFVGIIFSTFIFLLIELFPQMFIGIFISSESATMGVAINGLRIFVLALPVVCINILGVGFYQSIANGFMAFFLGLLRQIFLLIPAVLILPLFFGLNGVWASTPVAGVISVIITAIALFDSYKKGRQHISGLTPRFSEAK